MVQRKNEARWVENRERWQINVQKDGQRKTFTDSTPGVKGKIAAEKKADKWLAQTVPLKENLRFSELWELFLQETRKTTGTGNYMLHEQIGKFWLLPSLKHRKCISITDQDWQDCINAAFEKGRAKKTCQNIRASQVAVCRFARKKCIAIQAPIDVVIPRGAEAKEKKILQPNDINKLFQIDYIIERGQKKPCFLIYAWRFILLTGLRRGELCGIMNEDIEGDILTIKRSINKFGEETTGKNENARRKIVLSSYAKRTLQEQKNLLKSKGILSQWVFPDEKGGRLDPNHLYKTWWTYRKQHGLNCSIHEMRHTFISLAKADVPIELLKKIVGHSEKMDTFGVYGHEVEGEMAKVANTFDTIFQSILEK